MELQTSGRPIEVLMEKVLSMNIVSSDYFKELYKIKTYHEVIDEIYNQVDHVEPWMTGNCRGPSTAFCLLYKLFTMKLTVNQMHGLLKHPDSPYIRAIGFLYLRYAADPKTLWTWYEPYIQDDEEFSPGSNGKMTTMGVYVRDVILGQRAPHRASTRDSSPVRKTLPSVRERERSHDGGHAKSPPRKHRSQSRERSRDTERDRSDRDRGRYKDREHGWQSRDNRDRDYRRSSYSDRDVERRGHERRDRDSDRNGRSSGRRSRSRSRSPSRGRTNGDSHRSSPFGKAPESSNLAKLKDLYGDATNAKDDAGDDRAPRRDSGTEEVIRLGGARWR